jgi:hypothetical protein
MKSAAKTAAQALGAYAGLLAVEHGVFEILQGSVAPGGILINAIGPPCQAEAVWHACLPAMTIMPSFLGTGVLAVVVSLTVVIWSVGFVQRKRGGLVLILLSLVMLPLGGGFVAPLTGVIAGAAGTRIGMPLTWWRRRLPGTVLHLLAALWPWTLVGLLAWFPGAWILGRLLGRVMLRLGFLLFLVFDLGLPLLTVFSGLSHDALRRDLGARHS